MKGQISVQFNWIFVMIIGGMILLLTAVVVSNIGQSSNERIVVDIRNELRNFFTTTGTTEKTLFRMTMPKQELYYTDCTSGITVGEGGPAVDKDMKGFFMPNLLKSNIGHVWVWSMDWDVPYHTSNFIFIASPQMTYVFVKGSSLNSRIVSDVLKTDPVYKIPANVSTIFVNDIDELKNYRSTLKGNYAVKVIYLDQDPDILDRDNPLNGFRNVYAVSIRPFDGDLDTYGDLGFYSLDGGVWNAEGRSSYIGRALFYGAIFSDDIDHYACGFEYAIDKLSNVNDVYIDRADLLVKAYPTTDLCKAWVLTGKSLLESYKNVIDGLKDSATVDETYSWIQEVYDISYSDISSVSSQNELLLEEDCATLY